MCSYAIQIKNLFKSYAGNPVLRDVDFMAAAGCAHALLGGNGAGKSTLMKIIAGLTAPDGGEMQINGQLAGKLTPVRAQQLGVYLVPQEAQIFPNQSILHNIAMGLPMPATEARREVQMLCSELELDFDLDSDGGALEIASRQLVEILRGLIRRANILILDEPTSALSPKEAEALFVQIDRLKARGVCIIFISHKLPELRRVCEDISVLRDGRIALQGELQAIDDEEIIAAMRKAETDAAAVRVLPPVQANDGTVPVVLEVRGLCGEGFQDMSFTVPAGRITALAGMVGSGRSELAETLYGLRRPQGGEVRFLGELWQPKNPAQAVSKGLVYLPEDRQLNGLFLEAPLHWNMSAQILPLLPVLGYGTREKMLFAKYRDLLGVKCEGCYQLAGELSGGNQQKVLLAKCLASEPILLILDEPTRGVDINARADIYQIIRALAADGVGILLISSDFEEIANLADSVCTLVHGRPGPVLADKPFTAAAVSAAAFGKILREAA